MKLILYTTGCPKCKILKQKLISKNINFIESNNVQYLIDKNITEVPVLEFSDGTILNFINAIKWINSMEV